MVTGHAPELVVVPMPTGHAPDMVVLVVVIGLRFRKSSSNVACRHHCSICTHCVVVVVVTVVVTI